MFLLCFELEVSISSLLDAGIGMYFWQLWFGLDISAWLLFVLSQIIVLLVFTKKIKKEIYITFIIIYISRNNFIYANLYSHDVGT